MYQTTLSLCLGNRFCVYWSSQVLRRNRDVLTFDINRLAYIPCFFPPVAAVRQLTLQAQTCVGCFCRFILQSAINSEGPCVQENLYCCLYLYYNSSSFNSLIKRLLESECRKASDQFSLNQVYKLHHIQHCATLQLLGGQSLTACWLRSLKVFYTQVLLKL